jgi:hypothetical protein
VSSYRGDLDGSPRAAYYVAINSRAPLSGTAKPVHDGGDALPAGLPPGGRGYPPGYPVPAYLQVSPHAEGQCRHTAASTTPSASPRPVPLPCAHLPLCPTPSPRCLPTCTRGPLLPGTTAHLPSAGLSPPVDTPRRAVESHHSPSAAREPGGIPKGWPSGVANLFTSDFPAVRSRRDGQLSGNSRPRGLAVHRRVSSERGATRPRRRRRTMRPIRRLCGVRPCDA